MGRVFAVADLHGMIELYQQIKDFLKPEDKVYCLGDMGDRGTNCWETVKAIMNDFYARDISKKIKSSLKAKMKDGKYVGGRAPFGYTKDKDNKNQLIVDSEQAIIVRRIFDMEI